MSGHRWFIPPKPACVMRYFLMVSSSSWGLSSSAIPNGANRSNVPTQQHASALLGLIYFGISFKKRLKFRPIHAQLCTRPSSQVSGSKVNSGKSINPWSSISIDPCRAIFASLIFSLSQCIPSISCRYNGDTFAFSVFIHVPFYSNHWNPYFFFSISTSSFSGTVPSNTFCASSALYLEFPSLWYGRSSASICCHRLKNPAIFSA